ncbi:hypothetical protein FB567DRAFT_530941 [Paraphoma chrysanthemicola]|uniref:Uncharacterized protein n=1 Tax=Paraphoma chrysanthemicola TaxID=798071 RepID=A0A8K0R1B5_9PLEO|nr:hypothetical protein FB567DRAFT_530941 [Paraphoma chrysanthemicola]
MAPIQTQTMTAHQFSNPMIVISGRISKTQGRSTRTGSKALLSYTPQIPTEHPDINLSLLRNKLLLQCRQYIPSHMLHDALADGIYSRAERWITPSSQAASRFGKKKRYYVLHTESFKLQQVGSAWEARVCSASQSIDAGNGVVLFVKERPEWDAFMRGYRRQGKRAGQLMRLKEKDMERSWREKWKTTCGFESGAHPLKEVNAGPMWVLVKTAVGRIVKGEA